MVDNVDGTLVFVPDDEHLWTKAQVVEERDGKVQVRVTEEDADNELREVDGSAFSEEGGLPLQNAKVADDMTLLSFLHEPAILYNLRERFYNEEPYTYTGDILVAVNPYQWLDLYRDDVKERYKLQQRWELRPHAFGISGKAYRGVRDFERNQSILVSGESGAGKTETVKILMGHVAHIAGQEKDTTIQKVLASNPVLESFGNAKTARNDNSSRFGKYTKLQLSHHHTLLVGSVCVTYLLEKSRVVTQSSLDRNFHIFYQILAAPSSTRATLELPDDRATPTAWNFLTRGDCDTNVIEGETDAARFDLTMQAMQVLNIDESMVHNCLRCLAAILHMGEIGFEQAAGDDEDQCTFLADTAPASEAAGRMLGVDSAALVHAMHFRTVVARDETYEVPLRLSQALTARDALAKELYARLFLRLVDEINKNTQADGDSAAKSIALLDIFGFEVFGVNTFEQLCINFCNEKLQAKFTEDVFKLVQAEYQAEGVPWQMISYADNQPLLDLIEGRMGIISVLNEECLRPGGSDEGFASKLATLHDKLPFFSRDRMSAVHFTITHYAGEVQYTAISFMEKNRDTLQPDIVAVISEAENSLVRELFAPAAPAAGDQAAAGGGGGPGSAASTPAPAAGGRRGGGSGGGGAGGRGGRRGSLVSETVTTKFRRQLTQLMTEVKATQVQYVRCIKPNENKSSSHFNRRMVTFQLRYAGMIEAIRISRAAYPSKLAHAEFVARFHVLGLYTQSRPPHRGPPQPEAIAASDSSASLDAVPGAAATDRSSIASVSSLPDDGTPGGTRSEKRAQIPFLVAAKQSGAEAHAPAYLSAKSLGDALKRQSQDRSMHESCVQMLRALCSHPARFGIDVDQLRRNPSVLAAERALAKQEALDAGRKSGEGKDGEGEAKAGISSDFAAKLAAGTSTGRGGSADDAAPTDLRADLCVVGRTRVYFRGGFLEALEESRHHVLSWQATIIAATYRACRMHRAFRRTRHAVTAWQARWRRFKAYHDYENLRACTVVAQAIVLGFLARRRVMHIRQRRAATRIQCTWRMFSPHHRYQLQRAGAVRIQSIVRMILQKQQYVLDLAEFREQQKLENQIAALRAKLQEESEMRARLENQLEAQQTKAEPEPATAATTAAGMTAPATSTSAAAAEDGRGEAAAAMPPPPLQSVMSSDSMSGMASPASSVADASQAMLERLQADRTRLLQENAELKTQLTEQKRIAQRATDSKHMSSDSFAAMNHQMKTMTQTNEAMARERDHLRQSHATVLEQCHNLNEQIAMKHKQYEKEVICRATMLDAMVDIVQYLKTHRVNKKHVQEVEQMVQSALEADTGIDLEGPSRPRASSSSSRGGRTPARKARSSASGPSTTATPPAQPNGAHRAAATSGSAYEHTPRPPRGSAGATGASFSGTPPAEVSAAALSAAAASAQPASQPFTTGFNAGATTGPSSTPSSSDKTASPFADSTGCVEVTRQVRRASLADRLVGRVSRFFSSSPSENPRKDGDGGRGSGSGDGTGGDGERERKQEDDLPILGHTDTDADLFPDDDDDARRFDALMHQEM